jgi:hypothetical protein
MAQQSGGGGGGHFIKWLKKNYLFRLIIFFIVFLLSFVLIISMISNAINSQNIIQVYNEFMHSFSKELNYMPVYKEYANYFKAYFYYENYAYPINQGFYEKKFWLFWFMTVLEALPFFIVYFLFLPNFSKTKDSFFEYEKQLKWRSLKNEPNPISEMEKMIFTEGTHGEPSDTYSMDEVYQMMELYKERPYYDNMKVEGLYSLYKSKLQLNLLRYCKSLIKLREEYNNQQDWDNFFKKSINDNKNLNQFLFLANLNGKEWEEDKTKEEKEELFEMYKFENHFRYVQELKSFVSKELYIPSLNKELPMEELLKYYEYIVIFWMAKQTKNFPMYDYTVNIDMPIEFKIVAKWTSGRNAPGKINVPTNTNVPRRDSGTRNADIYYRIFRFKEYIGVDTDYMLQFLNRINKNLD